MFKGLWKPICATVAVLGLLALNPALAAWQLDMPVGVTTLSEMIRDLHREILIICTITAVVLFGVMGYALFAFRKSRGAKAATFSHNTTAEIIWTIIPIFVLIYMAVPSARGILEIEDAGNPDMTIKVTGYQWKWGYEYLDNGVSFFANLDELSAEAARLDSGIDVMDIKHYLRDVDNRMVVPVGKKVRILLTANDVIHSWWVPKLYIKKDAIPGFINEMWFTATETGVFRGQCTELCGRGHGYMPIVVEVVSEEDYAVWVIENGGESPTVSTTEISTDSSVAAL
ncbi:MAG: cytochrome c oxidase subunit II [Chromatiales bacterium]|jgi:cytochrome c oxidase subunit 2|nr:cytochrome c oxidase subunit II [Chromatiales bacterium]